MSFIEAPTTFYMGRRFDPTTRRLVDEVVYYDSRDLTTHAVVVGMTGSGKTGLCITLLEEAVMDGIPSIIIDPKGDITNLLLAFPDLKPEDFEPWVNVDDAQRAGLDMHEYAVDVAQKWRDGLASWGITAQRVRFFKDNARFSIYTPGSDAGLPISILDAMQAPHNGWQPGDDEFYREQISGIVTALLALVGRNVTPVKDREHVLISNIFEYSWRQGISLTLEDVIVQVQKPPFAKLGVFDVDTFFPEKERFALAMELNNIIAAPSFQSWIQGEPLDIQSLLYTPEGKPRVSIFYIAHLNEAERMFIVTLLLENMLSWMNTLSGTTSLRAILYFDEVFGYFPPHPYNPPSKEPILRLLKQARAFGLGMVIATQNPGDIDYKGLANAGTWFIGKLQTETDKSKVLSGLQSVATVDAGMNVDNVSQLLSSIDPRVFLMHNVHDRSGVIPIHSRWAMSFLRGPLTRQQIRTLMAAQRQQPVYPSYQQQPQPSYAPVPGGTRPLSTAAQPGVSAPPGMSAPPPPASLPEMPPSLPEIPAASNAAPSAAPAARPATIPPQPSYAPASAPVQGTVQPLSSAIPSAGGVVTQPPTVPPTGVTGGTSAARRPASGLPAGFGVTPPPISSTVAQYFLPTTVSLQQAIAAWAQQTGAQVTAAGVSLTLYQPLLLSQAEIHYADRKSGISLIQDYCYHVPNVDRAGLIRWEQFLEPYIDPAQLGQTPFGDAAYGTLSPGLTDVKRVTALRTEVADYIYKTAALSLMYNPDLDLYGTPDMSRRDFLVQAQNAARQRRDDESDKTALKYDKIFDQIEAKLRKTARTRDADQKQAEALRGEELLTGAEAGLSLLRGRTAYTVSRVSRSHRYKEQAQRNVYGAEQDIAELEAQLQETQDQMENELRQINDKWGQIAGVVQEYRLTPFKKDIYLSVFGIGWKPYWLVIANGQPTLIPAWSA